MEFSFYFTGQIPVVQLNFSVLSFESPFDRDTVEACVKEVLLALSRSIGAKRNVEFIFAGIGRLQIRDSKVKMKFYKDFLNMMDGSGKLIDALKDVSRLSNIQMLYLFFPFMSNFEKIVQWTDFGKSITLLPSAIKLSL